MENRRQKKNRISTLFRLAVSMAFSVLLLSVSAWAADLTLGNDEVSGIDNAEWIRFTGSVNNDYVATKGSVTIVGTEITISGTSLTIISAAEVKLVIQNNKDFPILVGYTITQPVNNDGRLTFEGGNSPLRIEANGTSMITLKAGTNWKNNINSTAKFKINEIIPAPILRTTTFTYGSDADYNHGTYKVAYGNRTQTISNGSPVTYTNESNETAYILTATPEEGYSLAGWLSNKSGFLSADNPYTYTEGTDGVTIWPIFAAEGVGLFYVEGEDTTYYTYLDLAIQRAVSSGNNKVVMLNSGKAMDSLGRSEITIPSGVTVLLPYATGKTTVDTSTTTDGIKSTLENANKAFVTTGSNTAIEDPSSNKKLEMVIPSGMTIHVQGKFIVGGTLRSNAYVACATSGRHANVQLEGVLDVQSGGIVSSCGYILGSGTLYAASGATLYQPFTIMDFRGGGFTASVQYIESDIQSGEKKISPFQRYSMQNIQTKVVMQSGAKMKAYCDLYTQSILVIPERHNVTLIEMIGSQSSTACLIKLADGATLTSTYDKAKYTTGIPSVGKTTVTIAGGAELGNVTLSVDVAGIKGDIQTQEVAFPIPYNYEFALNAQDGDTSTYTIAKPISLLPGARIIVGTGATLNVSGQFMVYDGLYDHSGTVARDNDVTTAYKKTNGGNYPKTVKMNGDSANSTAALVVDGTLLITSGKFGGVVQTNGTGTLIVDRGVTTSCSTQVGMIGTAKLKNIITYKHAGATVRTLDAQVFDPASGTKVTMKPGYTYYGKEAANTLSSYTYDLYTSSASPTTSESHNETDWSAPVEGAWWNYRIPVTLIDSTYGEILDSPDAYAYFADGASIEGTEYYLDAALTQKTGVITGNGTKSTTTRLYKQESAGALLVNGARTGAYLTLQGAADAYCDLKDKTNAYVKLLKDFPSTEKATIQCTSYLDMNGHTASVTLSDGVILYGMDSSVTDYTSTPKGKLTCSGGTVSTITENSPTGEYYVAIPNKDKSVSFHRFNISVTGYRFELTTGDTPKCALFFIGKFQGDAEAKNHLTKLGFTLKDKKGNQLGEANYEFTAGTVFPPMPNEGEASDSKVVCSGDAYLFEAYLMRSFKKDKPNDYTEQIDATAQATFNNGGTQDSEPKQWSFEDAWTNPGELDETQQAILDKFLKELGITKQAE